MHIPEEFVTFTAFFYQDFALMFPDGNGLIEDAINHTSPEQRNVIKEYLDDLLSGSRKSWPDPTRRPAPRDKAAPARRRDCA
jgi:hypothetical protein